MLGKKGVRISLAAMLEAVEIIEVKIFVGIRFQLVDNVFEFAPSEKI